MLAKKAESTPVAASMGKRRGRNDRSGIKVEKPTKAQTQVPFGAQDTNSPMKLRIQPEEISSAKSDRS